jgi:hypothetical protein
MIDSRLEKLLKDAPFLDNQFYNLRWDSVNAYMEDIAYQIYIIEEDELIEEAKDSIPYGYNVKESTIKSCERVYIDIKKEYKELKTHYKWFVRNIKGGK